MISNGFPIVYRGFPSHGFTTRLDAHRAGPPIGLMQNTTDMEEPYA